MQTLKDFKFGTLVEASQLQTPGQITVPWENIVNAPQFPNEKWADSVKYIVISIINGKPNNPLLNSICVDTSLGRYFKFNGSVWLDIGGVVNGDRVILWLDDNIYAYNGSSWVLAASPLDDECRIVSDDGGGKITQYVYSTSDLIWHKIGDVDYANHFNGIGIKHSAGNISVNGTYPNIPGLQSDLETTLAGINTKFGTLKAKPDDLFFSFRYSSISEVSVSSTTYNSFMKFIWSGSRNNYDVPFKRVVACGRLSNTASPLQVRLFNLSTNVEICNLTLNNSTANSLFSTFVTAANTPSDEALLEVSARLTTGNKAAYISALTINF